MKILLIINLISFALTGLDKFKARFRLWRIPEATLFLWAVCMGAGGVLAGMYIFRHKTRYKQFVIGIPLLFVLNIVFYYYY